LELNFAGGPALPSPKTWTGALDQIFRDFVSIEDAWADWLIEPTTGRRLRLDVLYPELGIAFWFGDSGEAARPGAPDYEAIVARLCRQAGITLVAPGSIHEVDAGALGDIRAALSRTARRVAQQEGAGEVKRDLLPRIASAKQVCLQILEARRAPAPVPQRLPKDGDGVRSRVWRGFPRPDAEQVATLGALLSFLLNLLKRMALFVVVLLAVNAAAYLVANFLYLRGPMAYNYVPDNRVSLAEMFATYPEYVRSVLAGDFGVMRLQEFGAAVGPIRGLMAQALPRSLVLLGAAVVFSTVVGITAGFLSVNYKTYQTNPLALVMSIAGFSMPGFYMAILIIYLMIWAAMNYGRGAFFLPTTGYGLDAHLILPVLALSARPTAEVARLTA
jgi:hypothetical protein